MSEVLNQSDIDALLNAASEPEVAVEAPPTQIFSRARRDREKIEIRSYDFKFGFVIPGSTNSWEFIYDLPELTD